jgi:D-aminopeptidase
MNMHSLPQDFDSQVDSLFARWATRNSPGAVVSVVRHGEEIHRGFYGMADLANEVSLSARSVVRIGSQTKQFTVLLLLMLEAEGKLSLTDDVRGHLPWLPHYPKTVTLHHLAAHVGGLRDYLEMMVVGGQILETPSSDVDARNIIRSIESVSFLPGEDFVYCNTGYFLLSEVVEKVSGRGYNELLRERITGPLGMRDTQLMPRDTDIIPCLASQYTRRPDGSVQRAQWGVFLNGVGGMVSTVDDMKLWLANLDSPKVGKPHMYARMSSPGATINGHLSPYGLGLVAAPYRGFASIGHYGAVAGGRSYSVRFPDLGLGIIILANTDDFDVEERGRRIVDICIDGQLGPHRSPEVTARLTQAVGTYRAENGDDVFQLGLTDGEPTLDGFRIEQQAPGIFRPEEEMYPLEFKLLDDGDIETRWFGRTARYRRLSDTALSIPAGLPGIYTDRTSGIRAKIWHQDERTFVRLSSAYGTWNSSLEAKAPDFYMLTSNRMTSYAPQFTMRAVDGGIVLNAPRSKKLHLARG